MARFCYPELAADVRAAFDQLAAQAGLVFGSIGTMPGYRSPSLTLYFGVEAGRPAVYVKLGERPVMTGEALLEAARAVPIAMPRYVASDRELTQQLLARWADALAPWLPALAGGRLDGLELQSPDEAAYEQRLRRYVHDHAPVSHVARVRLWESDWRVHAEAFVRETGATLV